MAHNFSSHSMIAGKFGPTPNNHYYQPVSYHNPTARKRDDKNRWVLTQSEQYEVFEIADTPDSSKEGRKCWMNDDGKGLYSMLDGCDYILGKDNEERLAFFPKPANEQDSWHGYPIDSANIGDNLVEYWKNMQLISEITYRRLLAREL